MVWFGLGLVWLGGVELRFGGRCGGNGLVRLVGGGGARADGREWAWPYAHMARRQRLAPARPRVDASPEHRGSSEGAPVEFGGGRGRVKDPASGVAGCGGWRGPGSDLYGLPVGTARRGGARAAPGTSACRSTPLPPAFRPRPAAYAGAQRGAHRAGVAAIAAHEAAQAVGQGRARGGALQRHAQRARGRGVSSVQG